MEEEVSRIFRSSFPDVERTDFRTGSWRVQAPGQTEELKIHHSTVLHAFAAAAKLETKTGITLLRDDEDEPEEHRTYKKLYEQSKVLAAALDAMKIKRGDRVLIVLPTSFEFVTTSGNRVRELSRPSRRRTRRPQSVAQGAHCTAGFGSPAREDRACARH